MRESARYAVRGIIEYGMEYIVFQQLLKVKLEKLSTWSKLVKNSM
jgi:hypothetical protein